MITPDRMREIVSEIFHLGKDFHHARINSDDEKTKDVLEKFDKLSHEIRLGMKHD